jgi:Protein of unknown function (DUF1367)
MSELVLMKTPAGAMVPADAPSLEFVQKLRIGGQVRGEFKRQRNPRFHRKVMALFKFAFDLWDAPVLEYKGQPVAKSFERFRKDLTVLAGHYEAVTNLRGEVRLEAKSLSFASMDEAEFGEVFKGILGVVWDRVLRSKGYESPERVEMLLEELLRFE